MSRYQILSTPIHPRSPRRDAYSCTQATKERLERKTGRPKQFHHKDTKVTELRLLYKNLLELSQLLELLGLVPRVSTGQNLQHQQNLVNRKIAILVLPFANWPKLCDLCVSVVKIVLVFRPSEMRLYGQSLPSSRPMRCSRLILGTPNRNG